MLREAGCPSPQMQAHASLSPAAHHSSVVCLAGCCGLSPPSMGLNCPSDEPVGLQVGESKRAAQSMLPRWDLMPPAPSRAEPAACYIHLFCVT